MRPLIGLITCLGVVAGSSAALGATIRVPVDQPSVPAAVAAAAAGDAIEVAEGKYPEEVTVDKPLTISGAGADKTFLSCGEDGTVITADAALTLEGLTIGPAKDGVLLAKSCTLTIKSCRISGCRDNGLNFASDFQCRLYMTDCEVTLCGDGVDLESTQGQAVNCTFRRNRDDGLDYDGDAGFLCVGCRFVDNADDGIEVRLARRTEVLLVFCTFGGNGEDGLELINTKKLDPAENIVVVSHCEFEGAGRWDLGCVDLLTPEGDRNEETSNEPPHAAVYLCANQFEKPLGEGCSPNILPIIEAAGEMPEQVTVAWTPADGQPQEVALAATTPVACGVINVRPNYQGGAVGDAEGLAVSDKYIYVGDDGGGGRIHCFDRATGGWLASAGTAPIAGGELSFAGPEGLSVLPGEAAGLLVLNDRKDKGADGAVVTEHPDDFGQFIRHVPMPNPDHSAEGLTIAGDTLYLVQALNGLLGVKMADHAPLEGYPVTYLFDGKPLHIAGVGYDGDHVIVSASAYPGEDKDAPVPKNYLLAVDPADGRPVAIQWIGAYCNDARGVACADGLVFVSDGWSHRKLDSGFTNKQGQKVLIFAAPSAGAVAEAVNHLPVRHLLRTEETQD